MSIWIVLLQLLPKEKISVNQNTMLFSDCISIDHFSLAFQASATSVLQSPGSVISPLLPSHGCRGKKPLTLAKKFPSFPQKS